MTSDGADRDVPSERRSPVGTPVVRGDEAITGERARDAVGFDPDDPESVAEAARVVRQFAEGAVNEDNIFMLRGAAACAALVRGVGSYKEAVERAGGEVTVSFVRKWARVHDLPQSIRRHVAMGDIAPTAAKHIARVGGEARYQLAWATIDNDLTVREVRAMASEINDGTPIEEALAERDVTLGRLTLTLDPETYRDLRRLAAYDQVDPGELANEVLGEWIDEQNLRRPQSRFR